MSSGLWVLDPGFCLLSQKSAKKQGQPGAGGGGSPFAFLGLQWPGPASSTGGDISAWQGQWLCLHPARSVGVVWGASLPVWPPSTIL